MLYCLLGVQSGSQWMCYYVGNLLYLDVLVVDEVLMIDLLMMLWFIDVLLVYGWVIFFGDCDQLVFVEVGVVLGDICVWVSLGYIVVWVQELIWLIGLLVLVGEGVIVGVLRDSLCLL